jgi:hypothetical protein
MGCVPIELAQGVAAQLVAAEGDRVRLRCSRPWAPGSRISGRLPDHREVRVKVFRCVRDGAEFELTGRLIDAPRELRALLARELVC